MELTYRAGNNAYTTSLKTAEGVEVEHRAVLKLIRQYIDDLNDIGTSALAVRKFKTGGRSGEMYELEEVQAIFLATLMKNSIKVVEFKKKLTKEFARQRVVIARLIQQRKEPDWQNVRKDGKAIYFQKTDVIKIFVDYATKQGSNSAKRYYTNLAKMENSALFFFEQKYKNLREVLTIKQLMQVATADDVIEKALKEGMEQKLFYKDIYKLAKERIIAFTEIIGESPVAELTQNIEPKRLN